MTSRKQQRREWLERNDAYVEFVKNLPTTNPVGACDDCGYKRLRLRWVGDRWTCEVCSPDLPWKGSQEVPDPCHSCTSPSRT